MNIEFKNIEILTVKERKMLDMLVAKANKPKYTGFVPELNERYYHIKGTGEVDHFVFDNDEIDNNMIKIRNCFKTKEEAQYYADRIKLIAELWGFAYENNEGEIDWEDIKQSKYTFCYDCNSKEVCITFSAACKFQLTIPHFTSKEIAQKAIDHFGEERLKTLFLDYGEIEE